MTMVTMVEVTIMEAMMKMKSMEEALVMAWEAWAVPLASFPFFSIILLFFDNNKVFDLRMR
jgi:hypothetical protein